MITTLWFSGLLARRPGRLLGAIVGVACTIALLATLGAFIAGSAATMTRRARTAVPVDWQILLARGADQSAITSVLSPLSAAGAIQPVGYADVAGLSATTNGTVQTTGVGTVLGIDPQYRQQFPAELRPLIGSPDGVLVAQQTAANLRVTVGDTVTIQRIGLPPADMIVAGVIDLPYADSLFQAVGVPAGVAPQAPPDNVLLLPADQWQRLFDPQAAARPDTVRRQLHVRLAQPLPSEPNAAFIAVQQLARNVEARIAGSAVVGDNLAAQLDSVRADALYARVLFCFLGLPGALLAMILTTAVTTSGMTRRRQEQALLRTRGATVTQVLRLTSVEAVLVGGAGVLLGLIIAAGSVGVFVPGTQLFDDTTWSWTATAAGIGFVLAIGAVLAPVWREIRHRTVATGRQLFGRVETPLWQRLYLDIIVLLGAAVMFWRTANTGYQLVLAPEGVPQTSVAYEAFLAPFGLWIGMALLTLRLWTSGLKRGRTLLSVLLRPLAHGLSGVVASSLGRQRVLLARGVVLVALAYAFATSIALFNTTYAAQAQVDAELTNGADVQVSGSTAAAAGNRLAALAALPGVVAAQPLQHRFAYVGTDLQDLFGIDPAQIGTATHMANAYFATGDASATLAALAATKDGVLVSDETMKDFQLAQGDPINVRLQSAHDNQYHVIPFHVIGVVREFPTAPKDSFLVANADYIAQQTGTLAAEIVLLRTSDTPADVAERARIVVRDLPGVKVTDITTTQRVIDSSLTAVDLRGLTALELSFAVLLLIGATGLVLGLSLVERQRSFAILAALGARPRQLHAFVWSEGLLLLGGGALIGGLTGLALAQILVTLLTHVFDPPPDALRIPWLYLVLLAIAGIGATMSAVVGAQWVARRLVLETMREL